MISISSKKNSNTITIAAQCALLGTVLFSVFYGAVASAQEALSLSVSPTLFEMSATPGQVWRSSVRVINTNSYPLTVYLEPVNFAPQGEGGTGKFLPVFEEFTEGKTLAEWVQLDHAEVTIQPERTENITFTVTVPPDASPGGHFAAILVGTKPPEGTEARFEVRTSSVVTSLFFVRIAGDVIENGVIREFRAVDSFLSEPDVDFELRFENKGNVHLQPQGEITIYNMWGKERGVIPINHQTHFGNVLPDSIRKFNFNWTGEWAFSEIGRYSAVVTLGYGEDGKKFVSSRTFFWIIPLKEVSITLGIAISILLFLIWGIKLYVRRMLMLAGVDPGAAPKAGTGPRAYDPEAVRVVRYRSVAAPVAAGVDDLRQRFNAAKKFTEFITVAKEFVLSYKLFFIIVTVLVISLVAILWYVGDAKTDQRAYEVVIENPDANITLSSEEVLYDQLSHDPSQVAVSIESMNASSTVAIAIVNRSGVPGAAATTKVFLEEGGFVVGDLDTDLQQTAERTVIVYNQSMTETALELSRLLNGALLSARPEDDVNRPIVVFLGEDTPANDTE